MSGRSPWWYSGEEEEGPPTEPGSREEAEPDDDTSPASALDWGALLTGAARMVDWATSAVMAPHAEHVDPADHPQCVVCRTITLVGDPTGLLPRPAPTADSASDAPESLWSAAPRPAEPAVGIVWIPIVEQSLDDPA
jgi:hypothetical protein